jgi:thiamine-phosphate pyrophosphorylase
LSSVAFRLLLITDGFDADTAERVAAALAALPAGAAAVQLRAKTLSARALYDAATKLAPLAHARNSLLLVNDRADVARAAGADGVHLPARGLPTTTARRWLGDRFVVGASTHSLAEATMAWRGGADYVTFGPVYATPSKLPLGEPVGVDALAAVVRAAAVPVFALGGIDGARARVVTALGARVACIGAVLGRADAADGARSMMAAIG